MGFNFISCGRDIGCVLPPEVSRWLPPEHLCWRVLAVVGELDLSGFRAGYRADGQGAAAYPPELMLGLVFYCYSKGIRSSRRVEAACLDDLGARIITGGRQVDHATVARFLRRHGECLKTLFVQVLALCARSGAVDLSAVAIDGSPMHANAARSSNRTMQQLATVIAEDEAQIARWAASMLDDTTADDMGGGLDADRAAPPAPADGSVGGLTRSGDRMVRARVAQEKLWERALPSAGEIQIKVRAAERMVARAEQRLAVLTVEHQARLHDYARRTREDQAAGRQRANGRPPVALHAKTSVQRQRSRLAGAHAALQRARRPAPTPSAAAKASLTDPHSRLMLGKRGGYLQGYNVQIACARNQLILAIEWHDNPADMTALVPVVARTQVNCTAAGITDPVRAWLADSGYASTANFDALTDLPLLVSVRTTDHHATASPASEDRFPPGHRDMAARLATPAGHDLYTRRSAIVEPGFAQLFQRFGRHLHYRGADSVDTELKLLGTVHNLNKLLRHRTKSRH